MKLFWIKFSYFSIFCRLLILFGNPPTALLYLAWMRISFILVLNLTSPKIVRAPLRGQTLTQHIIDVKRFLSERHNVNYINILAAFIVAAFLCTAFFGCSFFVPQFIINLFFILMEVINFYIFTLQVNYGPLKFCW